LLRGNSVYFIVWGYLGAVKIIILKILFWGVVVTTINLPVTFANGGGNMFACFSINISNKSFIPMFATRAIEPGVFPLVRF
jgi:hypothetical protein